MVFDPNLVENVAILNDNNDFNRHYGCLMSVCNYVEFILELFGVKLNSENHTEVNILK